MSELKRTPLYESHAVAGGRFVPFGGWEMPVRYELGIQQEHEAVRTRAGLFDVSHMGEIEVSGPKAIAEVNHIVTNDVSTLEIGQAMYSPMCNSSGGIVDDLVLYRTGEDVILICCNASNRDKDFAWIDANIEHSKVIDRGDEFAQLALQGPHAQRILQRCTDVDLSTIGRFRFVEESVCGVPTIISRTGYTGEDGFELYLPSTEGAHVWSRLLTTGADDGLVPVGLGARDTLRLEMKYCLYGQDINDETTPLEAGLGWTVKLSKGDFIGKEPIEKQKEIGIPRRLVCFEVIGRGVPRPGYEVTSEDGTVIGSVTSGTMSPTLKKGIGLAYVTSGEHRSGTKIQIMVRGKAVEACIVKPPFVKK
ncbi:MAG: glycine cleavage system aminomethyltransferase GcvT [Bradymonadia bacterium]